MLSPDAWSGETGASEEFGENKGLACYHSITNTCPGLADETVDHIARRATRIAMIVESRFDVDVDMASLAIINALESEFAF